MDFGTEVRDGYEAAGRRVPHHMRVGGAYLAHLDACHAPPELRVRQPIQEGFLVIEVAAEETRMRHRKGFEHSF